MSRPSAAAQIRFLQDLQRLLDEGSFTATYKFALLHAIADLCVTHGDDSGDPLTLPTADLARRFVQLYWPQAAPFPAAGQAQVLAQNTSNQAAVVNWVREMQPSYGGSLAQAQETDDWRRLVRRVDGKIREMPLWKLQTVGNERVEFLYENREEENPREITLKPGVAYCFRAFHPLITEMVEGAWVQFVRRQNGATLGRTTDLHSFLFGAGRASLARFRPLLEDIQQGRCFYCGTRLRKTAAVDHFIPWRRYPVDLGHNFVLAHSRCNGQKADRLAATEHLRRWRDRNLDVTYDLAERFHDAGVPHDLGASTRIARWAYEQVAKVGGHVWVRADQLVPLPPDWMDVFRN
jgi:5-methylcytosine-specific restriction endonuclease McrA